MASRLPDLSLTDAEAAITWMTSFKATARPKKWSDSEDRKEVTDNFMSSRIFLQELTNKNISSFIDIWSRFCLAYF